MVKLFLEYHHSKNLLLHCLSLDNLTSKQRLKVKGFIIDANNCLNGIFPAFNPLYKELTFGFQLVDTFSNCLSFNTVDHKINNVKVAYLCKLNKISLQNTYTVVVVSDTSVKNNVTMSIAHIHLRQNIIAKTIHHAINITLSKMKVVNLIYFPSLFYFHFPFDLFFIFLFLELRVRVRVTRSHSHIR